MVIWNRFVDCHWCRYLSCGNYLELWLFWASRYQEVCRYINWLARLQTFKTLLVYQLAITNIPILNIRNVYIYCTHIHKYQLVCPSCQCEVWPNALVHFFGILCPEQSTFEPINRWLMGGSSPNLYNYSTWLMSMLSMLIMRILLIIIPVGIHIQKF